MCWYAASPTDQKRGGGKSNGKPTFAIEFPPSMLELPLYNYYNYRMPIGHCWLSKQASFVCFVFNAVTAKKTNCAE